jgi:hypothetical protein
MLTLEYPSGVHYCSFCRKGAEKLLRGVNGNIIFGLCKEHLEEFLDDIDKIKREKIDE